MKNDLKDNYYLLELEEQLKFDIKNYQNLIKPLEQIKNKSFDTIKELDSLYTVLGYIKDKCKKLSRDLKVANSNPKHYTYMGYSYRPKIFNVRGTVLVDHLIYYKDKVVGFIPSNPDDVYKPVRQKMFDDYVKILDRIRKKKVGTK